jgi:hypothetical protein
VSGSPAEKLLERASRERNRLRRHLLVAAALREALEHDPIVVGGTAEEYHAAAGYHETDLDLCAVVTGDDRRRLGELGFRRRGRHWFHDASKVAVEFPDTEIDGDVSRVDHVRVAEGVAIVIGVDDLYVDRLLQATAPTRPEGSIEFASALAVAAGASDRIDRRYVLARIRTIGREDPGLAATMRRLDSRIMRRVRTVLAES